MNPNACRVVLRPRGPLEILDLALRLVRLHVGPIARLAAVVLLPVGAASWAVGALAPGGAWWLAAVVVLLPLLQAPFSLLLGRLLFSDAVTLRDVAAGVRRGALTVGLFWLLFDVLLVSFCIVGVIFLPILAFAPEVALLERVGLSRAVGRAVFLVGGHPIASVAATVARFVLPLWGMVVAELIGQLVVGWVLQLGAPFGALAHGDATPYAVAGMLACTPLVAAYRLLLYVDARTRTEGWDLQVAFRALALREGR